ncbi:methyl-accepting chemotaxis protein [Actinotalea sp. K2]|uniref:methyl-accepting chemotaxis protein n=1 Tax=Actinotalea sp. K2 TaxID=2939438 RepID=UPI0020173822|nr:methyl-accepting chemotaxis protein [Actinotalea sp. K2]MCL3861709.1 methyl-accepting chemotaxis protein [Actinotalea sp. K2]
MRATSVLPTGVERTFGDDEIIVSKIDAKGRFTYANADLLRVSEYDEADLIGQPHSKIRHPEMPRIISKVMWETIQDGQEMFAYVNNLASDGAHYWVFAHITPSTASNGTPVGYHSNRRSPGRGAVQAVDSLYRRLSAEEGKHSRPADAMNASGLLLEHELATLEMTYDEYVWSLAELESYRRAVDVLAQAFVSVAGGDLEVRIPPLAGPSALAALRDDVNLSLDVMDAFVRESGASLTAAAQGRFHRQFLVRGMPGTFRDGAQRINTARDSMRDGARSLEEQNATRQLMVDKAIEVSVHVASASTELGASAQVLAASAQSGVDEANAALSTVQALELSAKEIQQAVLMIKNVASQTRLLALNATIEAARAGEFGRGFAVVAAEVKTLADESARSSDDITAQVAASRAATEVAVQAIDRVAGAIHEMNDQVVAIAQAAGGNQGLSDLAETLHSDISRFASQH